MIMIKTRETTLYGVADDDENIMKMTLSKRKSHTKGNLGWFH